MEALALKKANEISEEDEKAGGYENVLEFASLPLPQLHTPHDVLIQVSYSDVNPVDLQKLNHAVKTQKQADVRLYNKGDGFSDYPFITGYGGTGTVQAVGDRGPRHLLHKQVCFLANPLRPGSYATHIVVDARCVAELPSSASPRDAAVIPVAGCTAYECLGKLGLVSDILLSKQQEQKQEGSSAPGALVKVGAASSTKSIQYKSLLVVGGSGGVGSWLITLAKALHPHLNICATASTSEHQAWCQSLGADQVMGHDPNEILRVCLPEGNAKEGSIDSIVCCTEPTPALFKVLSDVVRPYGTICLVVAGASIQKLDLGFCFFKCVNVTLETVFSSARTNYEIIRPREELEVMLRLLASQRIQAPLSQSLENKEAVSEKFKNVLEPRGILHYLHNRGINKSQHFCGKLVLCINSGMNVIFVDMKTASLIQIPRLDCIEQNVVPLAQQKHQGTQGVIWKDASTGSEREHLTKLLKKHSKLGIVPAFARQKSLHDLALQEAENVKNLWGVSLKKRERNKEGEELIFIDPHTETLIELSRSAMIAKEAITVKKDDAGNEIVEGNVQDADDRDEIIEKIRKVLKLLGN